MTIIQKLTRPPCSICPFRKRQIWGTAMSIIVIPPVKPHRQNDSQRILFKPGSQFLRLGLGHLWSRANSTFKGREPFLEKSQSNQRSPTQPNANEYRPVVMKNRYGKIPHGIGVGADRLELWQLAWCHRLCLAIDNKHLRNNVGTILVPDDRY